MNYHILYCVARIANFLGLRRMLWAIVKRNDSGNPYWCATSQRNRLGWIAWDMIDHCDHSFDNLR
jgi:hypothetical protein